MLSLRAVIPFVISVAGNLSLAWLFLSAILSPSLHREFIMNTGALIFLIEFFSIFSNAFATGVANQVKPPEERDPRIIMYGSWQGFGKSRPMTLGQMKWLIIALCMLAVGGVGLATKNWVLPLIFFVGLISKFFASRAVENPGRLALSIVALIALVALAAFVSVPLGFFAALPEDGDILVWGVLYYSALAFIDSAFFFRKEVLLVWKPFYYCMLFAAKAFIFLMRRSPQSEKFSGVTQRAFASAESGGFEAFLKSIAPRQNKGGKDTIPPDGVVY